MENGKKQEKLNFEYSKAKGLLLAKKKFAQDELEIDSINKSLNSIEKRYETKEIIPISSLNKERGKALLEYDPKYPMSYDLSRQQSIMNEYFVITGRKFKDDFESSDDIIKRILKRKFIIDEDECRDVIDFISDNPEDAVLYLPKLNKLLNEYDDRQKNINKP